MYVLSLFTLFFFATPVSGQDQCGDIIPKIVKTNNWTASSSEYAALVYDACSMTYDEHKKTYGGKAEVTWKVIGGKGEYNQTS